MFLPAPPAWCLGGEFSFVGLWFRRPPSWNLHLGTFCAALGNTSAGVLLYEQRAQRWGLHELNTVVACHEDTEVCAHLFLSSAPVCVRCDASQRRPRAPVPYSSASGSASLSSLALFESWGCHRFLVLCRLRAFRPLSAFFWWLLRRAVCRCEGRVGSLARHCRRLFVCVLLPSFVDGLMKWASLARLRHVCVCVCLV